MSTPKGKYDRKNAPSMNVEKAITGWVMAGLDYPTYRLSLLCKLMDRKTLRQLSERTGCTYPEWRVLARLGSAVGGMTVKQVAEAAWVDRAEVSRAVASLLHKGFATRIENPQDRRAPIHFLTKRGLQLYRRILEVRSGFHGDLVSDLTEDEREALDKILLKLAWRLQSLP